MWISTISVCTSVCLLSVRKMSGQYWKYTTTITTYYPELASLSTTYYAEKLHFSLFICSFDRRTHSTSSANGEWVSRETQKLSMGLAVCRVEVSRVVT